MMVLGLVDAPLWLILIFTSAILFYLYAHHNHDFHKKQGIRGPKPLLFFGNMLDRVSKHMTEYDADLRKEYGNIIGTFSGSTPQLITFDQEMISQVMVKRFHDFANRTAPRNGDRIWDSMLTQLEGEQWKHVRSNFSPTFTTGKLRQLSGELNRCAKQLADKMAANEGPFETKELAGGFAMDAIASTAFGLRVDSQRGPENPFVVHGKRFTSLSYKNPVLILSHLLPPLGRLLTSLGFSFVNKESMDFFVDIVKQTLDGRTEGDTSRSDFVQLMCNIRRGESSHNEEDDHEVEKLNSTDRRVGLSEEEILGNALIFFFAGYSTMATALTMQLYCLAQNQQCQNQVHAEMDAIIGNKDNVTYDDIMKLEYLDKCIMEGFRLYPAVPRIDRKVTNDTELNGIRLPKNSVVLVPVYALHHDPKIWDDPEKYDPERFSPAEKAKRNPILHQPFGYGPRNCIGQRLAMYELKVAIVHILRNNKIVPCEKTEDRIKWKKGKWLSAENGIWLTTEKRK